MCDVCVCVYVRLFCLFVGLSACLAVCMRVCVYVCVCVAHALKARCGRDLCF